MTVEFLDDPAAFLEQAADHLATDPVLTTVVATVTARMADHPRAGDAELPHRWWAVVRDAAGAVEGVAMRTAPFEPYPLYVLPLPEASAVELARILHERGEPVVSVNGALPAARLLAEEYARLAGGAAVVHERQRLHVLDALVLPPTPPGELRAATHADAELCLGWFVDFEAAAAEQAGREVGVDPASGFTVEDMHVRIDSGLIWLWEDEHGVPVHLTAANLPANGVTRIGPVYTSRPARGRGYASRAVAEVSQRYVEQGVRCCLFTDLANPVSNRVYEAIGYRPVVDMANLLITPTPGPA